MNNLKKAVLPISLGVLLLFGIVILQNKSQQANAQRESLSNIQMSTAMNSLNACDPRATKVYNLPIGSNELVGFVYPPRLGPLHTNIQQPNRDSCLSPFAAIYDDKVVFNCAPTF